MADADDPRDDFRPARRGLSPLDGLVLTVGVLMLLGIPAGLSVYWVRARQQQARMELEAVRAERAAEQMLRAGGYVGQVPDGRESAPPPRLAE